MISLSLFLAALGLPLALTPQAAAQQQEASVSQDSGAGALTGAVVSETNGAPVAGATVTVAETGAAAITDEQGRFRIDLPPGDYTVSVSFAGYTGAPRHVTVGAAAAEVSLTLRDDPRFQETIVIVGARTPRSVTKSPVPIDIITSEQIEEVGQVETNQVLRTVAPSYNATHQSISDGTDHIDPASLRGLGPDQVLVLLNGKRRHSSALVNINGTFGRGTVGVDLNAIPTTAIERIEVLRDGAAAQYGSDAIAGVVNVVLKEKPGEVEASAMSGITGEGDGLQVKTGLNYGVPIGDLGVLNLTGEFVRRNATDRSGEWTGSFYPSPDPDNPLTPEQQDEMLAANGLTRDDISMSIGQSEATAGMFFLNGRIPLGATEAYTTGSVTYRTGSAAGFYRRPEQLTRVVPEYYENGFLPKIQPTIFDWSATAGIRSDRDREGFGWDLSANHGGNWLNYHVADSNNASLGTQSPKEFDAGGFMYDMTALNADVVQPIKTGALKKLALVGGAEYRLENYRIHAGQRESWVLGPVTVDGTPEGTPKEAGSQVFPGFQPSNEVNEYRNSEAVYAGVESEINDRLLVDVAGRFENFDDFGATVNGKVAARLAVVDQLALRGAASTGFRAPSLQQFYFNNTSTQFIVMGDQQIPRQVLTARNNSEIAAAFGIPDLDEETSINVSGGFTFTPVENLSLTADGYLIDIDDRIVLTTQFTEASAPGSGALLEPFNVSAAQFFANAVDTRTWGTDVVLDYWSYVGKGRLGLTAAGNFTRTRVLRVNIPQGVADVFGGGEAGAVKDVVFNREEESRLEDAVPHAKGFLQGRYSQGPVSGLLRANYWGSVSYKALDKMNDEEFGAKVTLDADVGYQVTSGLKVAIGADNLLNTFPDKQEKDANIGNGQFIYSRRVSQFGVNGGFYYLRLQYLY